MSVFILSHIKKSFDVNKKELVVLDDINIVFPESGLVSITGKSGSGKSTLLNILMGIEKPTKGKVLFKGKNIAKFSTGDYCRYSSQGGADDRQISHFFQGSRLLTRTPFCFFFDTVTNQIYPVNAHAEFCYCNLKLFGFALHFIDAIGKNSFASEWYVIKYMGGWFHYAKLYAATIGCIGFIFLARKWTALGKSEWFKCWPFVIVAINILIAVASDFESAIKGGITGGWWVSNEGVFLYGGWWNLLNGLAGIINIACMTGWWGIYSSKKGKLEKQDMLWPDMTWMFIIAYDVYFKPSARQATSKRLSSFKSRGSTLKSFTPSMRPNTLWSPSI